MPFWKRENNKFCYFQLDLTKLSYYYHQKKSPKHRFYAHEKNYWKKKLVKNILQSPVKEPFSPLPNLQKQTISFKFFPSNFSGVFKSVIFMSYYMDFFL